jgi:glyoxylase-like metal-dependent hydrolase (beta-lactamase superfamily II)
VICEETVAENAWRVEEGLYRILLPLAWQVPFVNAFLIHSRGEYLLVDCGLNWPTSLRALGRALKAIGVPAHGLTRMLLTHRHPDHAAGAGPVHERWGGRLMLHPDDMGPFAMPIAKTAAWAQAHGMDEALVTRLREGRPEALESLPESVEPLLPGQAISVGDLTFDVIHVPGHCPGQVMLYERQRKWLLAADQVSAVLAPHVWVHAETQGDPFGEFLASLEQTATIEADLILPSHGMPMRGALKQAVADMLRFQLDYAGQVMAVVRERPQSTWEIARQLGAQAQRDPREARSIMASVLAVLIHLEHSGEITRIGIGQWGRRNCKEAMS